MLFGVNTISMSLLEALPDNVINLDAYRHQQPSLSIAEQPTLATVIPITELYIHRLNRAAFVEAQHKYPVSSDALARVNLPTVHVGEPVAIDDYRPATFNNLRTSRKSYISHRLWLVAQSGILNGDPGFMS